MVDRGHELTEEMLQKLEGRMAEEYAVAVRDMEKKLQDYLEDTEKKRQYWEGLLNDGKITEAEYKDWCYKHTMVGKRWEAMRDTLAQDMHHANEVALRMATGKMPDVYALNHNYGLYEIERASGMNTGLTLYNHDTAAYLLKEERQLMPGPSAKKAKQIAENKDMQWNQKKIQSAVLQGVIQGEGPAAVAKRLMKVGEMNYSSAVRYARTMTTSAQNAGRYESYHRANSLGIPLTIEWQAVLDSHTRHDHRKMHGQRRNIDEPFITPDGFQILYPADSRPGISTAPQSQIWNCRCTLRAWVKGHEGATVTESAGLEGMSFEEWQSDGLETAELFHKARKSDGESPFKPISQKQFDALTAGAKAQGAIITKGGAFVEKHLDGNKRASSIGNFLFFRDEVSKSDVHEELRHFWQWQTGFMSDVEDAEEREFLCEIDAKNYLINNRKRLKIPRKETEETIRELEDEMRKLAAHKEKVKAYARKKR